jgi:hypothetical protein
MINKLGYIVLSIFFLAACGQKKNDSDKKIPVAKVYEKFLYEDEVLKQIPFETSFEDSLSIRNSYVNSWIDRQLMVHQAELNLLEDEQDVAQKLEKYRNDLLIYSYQNQLLLEKLDTNVSLHEIKAYYNDHKDMFGLADYIVKARYIMLDSASRKNKQVKKWLMSTDESDFQKLEEFCYMHAAKFYLDDKWLYLYELLNEVPIVSYNKEKLLKNEKLIELYDNGYLYLVRLMDFKLKDGISPLSLEKESIKRIILNNRKLELLESLRTDIYQKAKNIQEIEIFVP